ncbi:MAG: hypothetical protein U9Q70_12890 [Chloroflexota bacterium]|nr:hypothetical protein [Chloroflexota bacterium]
MSGLRDNQGTAPDAQRSGCAADLVPSRQQRPQPLAPGGGIYGFLGTLQITGNTIADNYTTQGNLGIGGGLYLERVTSWLNGNTILDNQAIAGLFGRGGGIRLNNCPAFTLTNNIIASQTGGISNTNPGGSAVGANYTLFKGNGTDYGAGVNSTYEGPGSAAIDAGVATDIDGDPRLIGPGFIRSAGWHPAPHLYVNQIVKSPMRRYVQLVV